MMNEAADHMFEAAKRLHEADVHELAEQLAREAEKVRGEAHKPIDARDRCSNTLVQKTTIAAQAGNWIAMIMNVIYVG